MTEAAAEPNQQLLDQVLRRLKTITPDDREALEKAKAKDDFNSATAPGFRLTDRQRLSDELLSSEARHVMLYGGSRSGKTFLILRAIIKRALTCKSRHVVLRYRFNHVKNSVVHDTLPKVMEMCFPNIGPTCKLDKSDWYYELPNGSEIWFGGLDDKERTEKILGQEFATIFLNECSQIPWASRNMAVTRLAQKTTLRLKAFYDCNPPNQGHWTYKLFVTKKHPDQRGTLSDPMNYNSLLVNPKDNVQNLPPGYLNELENLPARMRQRFLLGQFGSAAESALWTPELIDQCRYANGELPQMRRVIIAVDPSGCSGPEDVRSDEIGIVVCGLGTDGKGYVLDDVSGRYGPAQWGTIVAQTYKRYGADAVIAEVNYGGAMVAEVIRAADVTIPVRTVTASRGKAVRAEPVAALFEQMKVMIAGSFPELEDQLCGMTTGGYVGERSPDRADAMIWGLASMFPAMTRNEEALRINASSLPKIQLGHSSFRRRN